MNPRPAARERCRGGAPARHARTLPFAAGALVALAVLFLFASSVHSVHHVGDEDAAAQCPLAAVVPHLAGIAPEPPCLESPFLVAVPLAETGQSLATPLASHRGPLGRAPPLGFFV